jgi:hypothetical protein
MVKWHVSDAPVAMTTSTHRPVVTTPPQVITAPARDAPPREAVIASDAGPGNTRIPSTDCGVAARRTAPSTCTPVASIAIVKLGGINANQTLHIPATRAIAIITFGW